MDNISKLKEDMFFIVTLLEPYYNDIAQAEDRIVIKGKTLSHANYEQASWWSYYDQREVEVEKIYNIFEQYHVLPLKGALWKNYTEKNSRDLNTRDKEHYINNETEFVSRKELLFEIQEVRDKFKAICNAFESRGYALRNLTDLHVNSLQDVII